MTREDLHVVSLELTRRVLEGFRPVILKEDLGIEDGDDIYTSLKSEVFDKAYRSYMDAKIIIVREAAKMAAEAKLNAAGPLELEHRIRNISCSLLFEIAINPSRFVSAVTQERDDISKFLVANIAMQFKEFAAHAAGFVGIQLVGDRNYDADTVAKMANGSVATSFAAEVFRPTLH